MALDSSSDNRDPLDVLRALVPDTQSGTADAPVAGQNRDEPKTVLNADGTPDEDASTPAAATDGDATPVDAGIIPPGFLAEAQPETAQQAGEEQKPAEEKTAETIAAQPAAAEDQPETAEEKAQRKADAHNQQLEKIRAARADGIIMPFRPYDLADAELGADGQPQVKNFSMNGWQPVGNYNAMRMISLWYGGPAHDPSFMEGLENLAAQNGLDSVQDLVDHGHKQETRRIFHKADGTSVLLDTAHPDFKTQVSELAENENRSIADMLQDSEKPKKRVFGKSDGDSVELDTADPEYKAKLAEIAKGEKLTTAEMEKRGTEKKHTVHVFRKADGSSVELDTADPEYQAKLATLAEDEKRSVEDMAKEGTEKKRTTRLFQKADGSSIELDTADARYQSNLEELAKAEKLTLEEMEARGADKKTTITATGPDGKPAEMDSQSAIFATFRQHSALMAHFDAEQNPQPIVSFMMKEKSKSARRKGQAALLKDGGNPQSLIGSDLMFRDSNQNIYKDDGRSVRVYVGASQKFGPHTAMNQSAIHIANRLKPANPGETPMVALCVNTNYKFMRLDWSAGNYKEQMASHLLGYKKKEHSYNKDLMILSALHEGERAKVDLKLEYRDQRGVKRPVGQLDVNKLDAAAVAEMRLAGIDVDGLIQRHNNKSFGYESAVVLEGDDNTPGFNQGFDAALKNVNAQATTAEQSTAGHKPMSLEDIATKPVGQVLAGLTRQTGVESLVDGAAHKQAQLMSLDTLTREPNESLDDRKSRLSGLMNSPDAFNEAVAKTDPANFNTLTAQNRAVVDAGKGLGDNHAAVPPFMAVIEAEVKAGGMDTDKFYALKDASLLAQASARLELAAGDPARAAGFPAARVGDNDPADIRAASTAFNDLKTAAAAGPLSDMDKAAARKASAIGRNTADTRLRDNGLADNADRLLQAFATQDKAAPATAADSTMPAADTAKDAVATAVASTVAPVVVAGAPIVPPRTRPTLRKRPGPALKV